MLHRRGHAREILHRAQAHVQVQHLAQRHVQRTDAAADRRGERSLDAHEIFLEGFHRVIREPIIETLECLLAREDLEPGHLALAAVGLFHRRVKHADARRPDVRPRAVAPDERDHRIFRHRELAVCDRDFPASGDSASSIGHDYFLFILRQVTQKAACHARKNRRIIIHTHPAFIVQNSPECAAATPGISSNRAKTVRPSTIVSSEP